MLYMLTFTINIPQMLAYTPYMDPMGLGKQSIQLPSANQSHVVLENPPAKSLMTSRCRFS